MVWTCAHTLCNNDGPSLGWIMGGGVSIYIYIWLIWYLYCQHLPTHWWTNHSELAYLIRDPSPTTPRGLLRKRQLKRWMMQPVSRRDPPSRRNNVECLERYWVRPLNTKGTHQWNENELRTACLLRLWVCVDADFLLDIYIYIYIIHI